MEPEWLALEILLNELTLQIEALAQKLNELAAKLEKEAQKWTSR